MHRVPSGNVKPTLSGNVSPSKRGTPAPTYSTRNSMQSNGGGAGLASDESFFSAPGVIVTMEEVSTIYKPNLLRRLRCKPSPIALQQAIGVFSPGKVHVVASPILKNTLHALYVLSGTRPPHQGDVLSHNIPVHTSVFRRMVGWVRRRQAPYDLLANRKNVIYHLRRKRQPRSGGELEDRAESVLSLLGLDADQQARYNSPLQQLLLQLAMELSWDPPVLFLVNPLEGLASYEHKRIASVVHNLASRLGKTVFISTTRLPLALYERVDTLLLLGVQGHTFFSGPIVGAKPYFESLNLSETYAQMPTQRLNSNVFSDDDVGSPVKLVLPPRHQDPNHRNVPSSQPNTTTDSLNSHESILSQRQASSGAFPPMLDHNDALPTSPSTSPSKLQQQASKCSRYFAMETSRDQRPLQVADGETMLDLARLWSESDEETCMYAVTFFDSSARQELARQIGVIKGVEKPTIDLSSLSIATAGKGDEKAAAAAPTAGNVIIGVRNLPFNEPNIVFRVASLVMGDAEQSLRRGELYLSVVSVLLVLVLCGWAMSHVVDKDQDGMQNVRGIIFFLFVMGQELNMLLINGLRRDVDHYIDQRRSGTVSSLLFMTLFLVKLLLGRVVLLSVVAGFFFYAMQNSATNNFVVLWGLHSVSHLLLVFLVVLLPASTKFVRGVCFAISGYFALMSGFLINLTSMPEWTQYTSLLRFGYGAVLNKYLVGKPYSCDASLTSNVTSYCYTGDQYLRLEGLENDSTDRSAQVYSIVVAVLTVLCWLRLHFIRM